MSKMYINVVHRVDDGEESIEALKFQQDEAHRYGLKTTLLIPYHAMFNDGLMDYVKTQCSEYGDEAGIHFHGIQCREFKDRFYSEEKALHLFTFDKRKEIISCIFDRYTRIFKQYPRSLGAYYIDARTLEWMKEQYPGLEAVIVSCFEEGVHMYAGTMNQWYLFSEGGPWGVYYPSRSNSLCPALNVEESVPVVALPHLNRDMVLALTSRDDYFSSHPANIMRGKANNGDQCPYLLKFVDQWTEQVQYNDFSYYNLFVSTPWLLPDRIYEESSEHSRSLYSQSLSYLKEKVNQGVAQDMTMGEFAAWYKEHIPCNSPEVSLWKDILCGSKRRMFWYADPFFRVTLDANTGGTICDLRPYAGRLERNLGPDTVHLANGSYPFIISAEHRGGLCGGSIHTCKISYNGITEDLIKYRTGCRVEKDGEGRIHVHFHPVRFQIGELELSLSSLYAFSGDGKIEIRRRVEELSDPDAQVVLTEYHKGCWGTTQYPEDMRGIFLGVEAADAGGGDRQEIEYAYESRSLQINNPHRIKTEIPQVECTVELTALNQADQAAIYEGYLFNPFYTMEMKKTVGKGGCLHTCLSVQKRSG